jgi:hypothetical protein
VSIHLEKPNGWEDRGFRGNLRQPLDSQRTTKGLPEDYEWIVLDNRKLVHVLTPIVLGIVHRL